jgi:cytochrome c oxidase assembly factor CtaG
VPERFRRIACGACALAALAAIAAPAAAAHGGKRLTLRAAGPYSAEVYALLVRAGDRYAIDYTSYLRDRRTGFPVDDASVTVLVKPPDGRELGPFRANAVANSYEVLLPVSAPQAWRQLRLLVSVRGSLGTASFSYTPPSLATEWLIQPLVLAGAAAAALLFAQAFVRLRRRGRTDHAGWGRAVLFALGLCLAVLPLISPLDAVGDTYLLSAHMLEHVLIGDAAPALLLVALRGPLLFFFLPPLILRQVAHAPWLRRLIAFVTRPRTALVLWAIVIGFWHIPRFYDYVLTHQLAHDFEHATFFLAGVLVWALLIDPARTRRLSPGRRLATAALLMWMGTALSYVLLFSFRSLYPAYANQAERLLGLSPLRDQQAAGLVMMVEQLLSLGIFAALLIGSRRRQVSPAGLRLGLGLAGR